MDAAILLKKYLHWRFDKKNGLHGCVNLSQAGKKKQGKKTRRVCDADLAGNRSLRLPTRLHRKTRRTWVQPSPMKPGKNPRRLPCSKLLDPVYLVENCEGILTMTRQKKGCVNRIERFQPVKGMSQPKKATETFSSSIQGTRKWLYFKVKLEKHD